MAFTSVLAIAMSCDKKTPEANTLEVTPASDIKFTATENSDVVLNVNTDAESWSFTAPDWVVATADAKTLTVNVKDNSSDSERSGKIEFKAGNAQPVSVNVSQSAPEKGEDALSVTPEGPVDLQASGNAELVFTVETNVEEWSFKAPEWTESAKDGNTLKVTVEDNASTEPREGTIEFTAGTKTVTVTLKQAGKVEPELEVSPSELPEFSASGNAETVLTVTTNVSEWGFTVPEWISAEKVENTLKLNVQDNSGEARSGEIVVTADTKEVRIAVSQAAYVAPFDKPMKAIYYCEVNSTNPLNALEYRLDNGTPFFDAVVLFSANIRYDSALDNVYLYNNPNVQALLDENETYLQPLRKAGIKVYLGLLGDHTAAGLCNLTEEGADMFADEVAYAISTYNLDGVAMDDEYTEGSATSPYLEARTEMAGARLCTKLKEKMGADKDIVVFGVGKFNYKWYGNLVSVLGGYIPGDFMDVYVADYGTYEVPSSPFEGMEMNQLCAYSLNCSRASDSNINYISVDKVKEKMAAGYGWWMWFAFEPNPESYDIECNVKRVLQSFDNVCQGAYECRLAMPVNYYKKLGEGKFDATPYKFSADQLPELQ